MTLQHLLTAMIVLASAVYAAWTLMPAAWRQGLGRRLLKRELVPASGCGSACQGCSTGPSATALPNGARPITVHRRPPG